MKENCECCLKESARTGVRLRQGWAQVCRGCAEHIRENRAMAHAPGVILESRAAQAAFDSALRAGMTIADATAIAEPVEREHRRAHVLRCIKLGVTRPIGNWYTAQYA